MRPFYKDKLATIYNSPAHIKEADVVILDPPEYLKNVKAFKAHIYIIFCGNLFEGYAAQLSDMRMNRFRWHYSVGNDWRVYNDSILIAGNTLVPGESRYRLRPLSERGNVWDRPVELMLNLLTNNDGLVLDPFMGSGNSLVASKMLGRKAIGFDTNKDCCQQAAERLSVV